MYVCGPNLELKITIGHVWQITKRKHRPGVHLGWEDFGNDFEL
jgi:hypothetical protein